jgi:hypothetical protein
LWKHEDWALRHALLDPVLLLLPLVFLDLGGYADDLGGVDCWTHFVIWIFQRLIRIFLILIDDILLVRATANRLHHACHLIQVLINLNSRRSKVLVRGLNGPHICHNIDFVCLNIRLAQLIVAHLVLRRHKFTTCLTVVCLWSAWPQDIGLLHSHLVFRFCRFPLGTLLVLFGL